MLQLTDALVVPIIAIREINSQNVIYVMQNGTLTPIPITVVITSNNYSQVASGNVSAGD